MINLFNITYSKKFPFIHISKSNLFAIFFISLFLGIAGFVLETIIEYVSSTTIVDRGFLNGPFIPVYFIYCFIALLFIKIPTKTFSNFIKLTFLFAVLVTILELITGNLIELITKSKLWNYDHLPLSGTYISFIISSIWGILTSFFFMFLVTPLYKITLSIDHYLATFILSAFFIIFSVDLTLTILDYLNKGKYEEKYHIAGSDTLTGLFLLEFLYFITIFILFYYFIKRKKIKKSSCGLVQLYLYFIPFLINILILYMK